jgi:hypothetical protein
MNRHIVALTLKLLLAVLSLAPLAVASDMATIYQRTGRVDESDLAQAVANARIDSFNLSPSGKTIAFLVTSGNLANAPTWLLTVDARTAQVLGKLQTGNWTPYWWDHSTYLPPQVIFTPDGGLLVIQQEGQVRIVEVATLRTVRTIETPKTGPNVPISICGTGKSNLFAISFGTGQRTESQFERIPVHVEVIDVSDGTRHGSWESDDIPQSLSPDGKLAAISDHEMGGALLKLDIIDTSSGKKLAVLDGGFKFEKPEAGQVLGRVVGRFLSAEEVLLGPDSGFDRSGHHSGDSLRIVHIPDGRVVQELKPKHFGPTGEVAVSEGGGEILAASWYLKPSFLTHPHEPVPAGSVPELLVFSAKGDFHLEGTIQSAGGGLRVGGSALRFRVASDGSVVAIAEHFGITLFGRTKE